MSHSNASIVRQLLIDLDVGVLPPDPDQGDWPIYVSRTPESPDECITVFDTQGIMQGRHMATGEQVEHYGIMLQLRSNSYEVGNAKIDAIIQQLDQNVYGTEVTMLDDVGTDGTDYIIHSMNRKGSVNTLGKDPSDQSRYLFTVNYTLTFN